METADWLEVAAEAAAAIREIGAGAALIRSDPATGPAWRPGPATERAIPVSVILGEWMVGEAQGAPIAETDLQAVMAAEGVEPLTSDRLRLAGQEYRIIAVSPVQPADVALVWRLVLRR